MLRFDDSSSHGSAGPIKAAQETAGVGLQLNAFLQGVYFEVGILALLVFGYAVRRRMNYSVLKINDFGNS